MNYLVPLMIGTSDTAFPRINNIAFWFLVPSLLFGVLSCLIDEGPGTGWTVNYGYAVIKCYFLHKTPDIILIIISILNYYHVTIFNIIGQYAWLYNNNHQRLNIAKLENKGYKIWKSNSININEWIIGLIDSNGSFNININEKNIDFILKITLLKRNSQLLHKLKTYLKVGSISYNNEMIYYKINNKEILLKKIIPILDSYYLLSNKRYDYLKFKECLLIFNNSNLDQFNKINQIKRIKNKQLPINYLSDHWNNIKYKIDFTKSNNKQIYHNINIIDIQNIMTKSWLIGYIEGKGLFKLIENNNKINHEFKIKDEENYIILLGIKLILNIRSSINNNEIKTINSKTIEYIIKYFTYNDNKSYFSGMISYEFNLWNKSYQYNNNKLYKIMRIMNNYRT